MSGVVGMDLSLTRSAAVWLPRDWTPGDWGALCSTVSGSAASKQDHAERARRLWKIALDLALFVAEMRPERVCAEDYAMGLAGNAGLWIAELGGAVKAKVYERCGHAVVPVNQNTIRKFFYGKLPASTKGHKLPKGARAEAVHSKLREAGAPFLVDGKWDADRGDAFLVANYARTELGLPGLSLATEAA